MLHRVDRGDLVQAQSWNEIVRRVAGLSHDPHRRLGELSLRDRGEAMWFGPFECGDHYVWMTYAAPIYAPDESAGGPAGCVGPTLYASEPLWVVTRTAELGALEDQRLFWCVQEPTSGHWYAVPCCVIDSSSPDSSSPDSSSPDSSSPDSSSPPGGWPPPRGMCCPIIDDTPTICLPSLESCELGLYGAVSGCEPAIVRYSYFARLYSCMSGPGPTCCHDDLDWMPTSCRDRLLALPYCGDSHTITHVQWTRLRCTPPYVGTAGGVARNGEWTRPVFGGPSVNAFLTAVVMHCDDARIVCDTLVMVHVISRIRLTWDCDGPQTTVTLDVELSDIRMTTGMRRHVPWHVDCVIDCPTTATYSGTFEGQYRPHVENWYSPFSTVAILPLVAFDSACGVYDIVDHCEGGPWQFPTTASVAVTSLGPP